MTMEIIFLVVAIFSGDRFHSLEVRNFSEFAADQNMDCEKYIGSQKFRTALKLQKIKQPRVRAQCLAASQVQGLESLLNQATTWKEIALHSQQDAILITGKIRHNPTEEGRKSVDSYLGKGLVLVNSDGEFALYPSEKVRQKDLIRLDGKKVKLRAIFEDHTPKDGSIEQYPTDGQGAPMKRVGYRVIAIE